MKNDIRLGYTPKTKDQPAYIFGDRKSLARLAMSVIELLGENKEGIIISLADNADLFICLGTDEWLDKIYGDKEVEKV